MLTSERDGSAGIPDAVGSWFAERVHREQVFPFTPWQGVLVFLSVRWTSFAFLGQAGLGHGAQALLFAAGLCQYFIKDFCIRNIGLWFSLLVMSFSGFVNQGNTGLTE